MAMLPNYYCFVPKVKWTDGGAVVELEDHSHADIVEVVRCRECRHRYYYEDEHEPVCTASMAYANTPDDWFCKDGQRREDGDT